VPGVGGMWIIIEYVEVRRRKMKNDMNIYMKLQEARCRLQSMNLKKAARILLQSFLIMS
jgi:hypothetical protein